MPSCLMPARLLPLAGLAALAACDRAPPPPPARPQVAEAAPTTPPSRSIMRPGVTEEPPAPPPAPEPLRATVSFASGPALDDAARATLDGFAAKAGADSALVIRGSTDSRGADTRNRAVSLRRARLVADYLASKGIAKDRMTVIGLGEDRPVAPNAHLDGSDDPEGRARNRRVEIEVTPAAPEADAADANASESSSPE